MSAGDEDELYKWRVRALAAEGSSRLHRLWWRQAQLAEAQAERNYWGLKIDELQRLVAKADEENRGEC